MSDQSEFEKRLQEHKNELKAPQNEGPNVESGSFSERLGKLREEVSPVTADVSFSRPKPLSEEEQNARAETTRVIEPSRPYFGVRLPAAQRYLQSISTPARPAADLKILTEEAKQKQASAAKTFDPNIPSIYDYFDVNRNVSKQTYGQQFAMSMGLPFASTPEGREDIIAENVPMVLKKNKKGEIEYDEKTGKPKYEPGVNFETINYPVEYEPGVVGYNPLRVAKINGKEYYVDDPRFFSKQTSRELPKQVALGLAAAAPAVLAAPASVPAAAILGGVGALGSEVAGQSIAKAAGSKEPYDYAKMAIQTAIGAISPPSARNVLKGAIPPGMQGVGAGKTNLFSTSQKNVVKNEIEKVTANAVENPNVYGHPDMRMLDAKFATADAANQILHDPASPQAKIYKQIVDERAAKTAERVAADSEAAFGPITQTQQQALGLLNLEKDALNDQLSAALKGAGDVNIAPVLQKLDELRKTSGTSDSPQSKMIEYIRKQLVETKGPKKSPLFMLTDETAIPGQNLNAQNVQNALRELDASINFGRPDQGIPAKSILPSDITAREIRTAISQTLKDASPEYKKIIEQYPNIYDNMDAVKLGNNLFKSGEKELTKEQIEKMIADPVVSDSFLVGARNAIDRMMRGKATQDELKALQSLIGREHSALREKMETMYGKDAVEKIASTIERENIFANTKNVIDEAMATAETRAGQTLARERVQPVYDVNSPLPVSNRILATALGPLNRMFSPGPGQFASVANFYALPVAEAGRAFKGEPARRGALRQLNYLSTAGAGAAGPQYSLPQDRTQRASGGKVGINHSAEAQRLIGLAERAKKQHNETTKPLLDEHDDTITHALKVANDAI